MTFRLAGETMQRNTMKKLTMAVLAPMFAASAASAATLYSETTPLTGTFFVSQASATTGTNPTVNDAILDNVVVPSYPAPGLGGLNVTRVTVSTVEQAGAPGGNLSLYYSTITADRTGSPTPAAPVIAAPTLVTSAAMPANGGASTVTNPVVFGNGTSTLFSLTDAQLNFTDPGVNNGAEFILGFKNDSTSALQGIQLAKPDAGYENPVEYYEYNTSDNGQATFTFFTQTSPNDGAGFWVTVEGNVVPEPATLGLAALGGLALLARRPKRNETVA
jgi:hypothetical protein